MLSYSHFFESWNRDKALEGVLGALRLASALRSSWPRKHHRIAAEYTTTQALQLTSRSRSDSIITLIRLSLQTEAVIARAEIAEIDYYSTLKICWKER